MGGKKASPLSLGAEGDERRAEQAFSDVTEPPRRASTRVLFVEDDLLGERRAAPAVFLGPADARPARLTEHALPRHTTLEEARARRPGHRARRARRTLRAAARRGKIRTFWRNASSSGEKRRSMSEAHLARNHGAVERRVAEQSLRRLGALEKEVRVVLPREPYPAVDLDALRRDAEIGIRAVGFGQRRRRGELFFVRARRPRPRSSSPIVPTPPRTNMSASLCLMAWNEPMGRPNCTRVLA